MIFNNLRKYMSSYVFEGTIMCNKLKVLQRNNVFPLLNLLTIKKEEDNMT